MLSSTPKADDAKTKSGHKDGTETNLRFFSSRGQNGSHFVRLLFSLSPRQKRVLLYGVGILLALFAVLAPSIFYRLPTTTLNAGGQKYTLEIASTSAEQTKGLGDRRSMADDRGMLFVFGKPAKQCFWMKGMEFPLDMIWLSGSKQVVYEKQNVSPNTYPASFCSTSPAKYVIELNAGQANMLHIRPGSMLTF